MKDGKHCRAGVLSHVEHGIGEFGYDGATNILVENGKAA
jgi:hypothetical protein